MNSLILQSSILGIVLLLPIPGSGNVLLFGWGKSIEFLKSTETRTDKNEINTQQVFNGWSLKSIHFDFGHLVMLSDTSYWQNHRINLYLAKQDGLTFVTTALSIQTYDQKLYHRRIPESA